MIYSFFISLIILTGYFSLFYIFPFFISLVYLSYTKNKKRIYLIICIALLSIIFTFILYPKYFSGFFSDRASEALTITTANNFFHNLTQSITHFGKIVSFFLCGTTGLIFIIICTFYNRKNIYSFFLDNPDSVIYDFFIMLNYFSTIQDSKIHYAHIPYICPYHHTITRL